MAVHPLLTRAKVQAEAFTVRPHDRGFVVWRFRDWTHDLCGWRPIAYASTRDKAEAQILARFPDLNEDEPPDETPPVIGYVWDYGGMWP